MKRNKFFVTLTFITFIVCTHLNAQKVFTETSLFVKSSGGKVYETLDISYAKVSCLTWEIPFYLDFAAEEKISFYNFLSSFGINFSIPNNFGSIEDRDFYLSGDICQFSKHENHLDSSYFAFVNFGCNFLINNFKIIPLLGLKYQFRKFSAWNGYVQSPSSGKSWSGNEEKNHFVGNGISYEQNIVQPFLKTSVNYKIKKNFFIEARLTFSPYIFSVCKDSHYFRNKEFIDKMKGGFSFALEAGVHYKKTGLYFSYEYLKTSTNANTWEYETGKKKSDATLIKGYIPGFISSIWSFGFSYCF